MPFEIGEKHGRICVTVHGLDPSSPHVAYPLVDKMNRQIKEAYSAQNRPVVFDFLNLHFIDSYMISMLVQASRLTEPVKNAILISDSQILGVLKLIGIDRIFTLFTSEKEWLKSL
jgi:anti-anti-sigma regulatory factor